MKSLLEIVEDDGFVKAGYGRVGKLMAGLKVTDRHGKVLLDKEWPSRSFNNNFGRLMQGIFDHVDPVLKDIGGIDRQVRMAGGGGTSSNTARLVPRPAVGPNSGPFTGIGQGGARLGIGIGPLNGNDATFTELENLYDYVDAHKSTGTTQDDATAIVYVVTQGITVVDASGIDVTEMGLYGRFRDFVNGNGESGNALYQVLLAYDNINPLVHVPQGGVIAPKYTITWAA